MIEHTFSRYRVIHELGSGGMGVVYRAHDTMLQREVALKLLPPAVVNTPGAIERFLREARAAAALNHPNICTIYEAGEQDGRPFIAMELLEGQTLQQLLSKGPPLLDRALDIAIQIAGGLAAAHVKGISHRDIKPANIYVAYDGRIKILDFGLAKLRSELDLVSESPDHAHTVAFMPDAQSTGRGALVGTVPYMSPEQAGGDPLDTRTDLFSFGVVLYEMCTGRLPFVGDTWAVILNSILSHTPAPLSTLAPHIPPELEAIVNRALEKDREQRYQEASEVVSDLRHVRGLVESDRLPEERRRTSLLEATASDQHRSPDVDITATMGSIQAYLERFPDIAGHHLPVHQYVWPAATVQDANTGHELSTDHIGHLLGRVLREDRNAFVLLLGDYGSGKTSFLRMFGNELAHERLKGAADAMIPIYLSLGSARNKPSLLDAMSAYLARYGISLSAAQLSSLLLSRGNVVLLLDGFDEMAGWVDYRKVPEILEKIHGLQLGPGVRIVLSGRSSFFRSDMEVGIVQARYVVRLSVFDDKSMRAYVSLRDPAIASRAAALFSKHKHLRELCRNPIRLMLFVNWLGAADSPLRRLAPPSSDPSVQPPSAAELQDVSVVDLYQRFFLKTLQDNFGTITKWSLDQRWEFVRRLACDWFKEGIFEWPLHEFAKRIETELPELARDEIDAYTLQLLNCTFFTRVGDRYRFLHQSYLEYLVSEALCKALWRGDLAIWDTPLYTDIYEMTYRLLEAEGFERIPVDWVMHTGTVRAQANLLAMSWRHKPPAMEAHLRTQLRHNPHDIVRFLAAMGMGLYDVSPANVEQLVAAFTAEENTIVKAMIQRVASHWLSHAEAPSSDSLRAVVDGEVILRREDAERATLQHVGTQRDAERALFAFRRAMIQGDSLWTAAVGGILSLAMVGHSSSFSYIYNTASAAAHPEIRNAYRLVQRFTALSDLPSVG